MVIINNKINFYHKYNFYVRGTHGYAKDGHDAYQRGRRHDPDYEENPKVFHDTVQVGHIPLVFVAEWNAG